MVLYRPSWCSGGDAFFDRPFFGDNGVGILLLAERYSKAQGPIANLATTEKGRPFWLVVYVGFLRGSASPRVTVGEIRPVSRGGRTRVVRHAD